MRPCRATEANTGTTLSTTARSGSCLTLNTLVFPWETWPLLRLSQLSRCQACAYKNLCPLLPSKPQYWFLVAEQQNETTQPAPYAIPIITSMILTDGEISHR